MLNHDLSVRVEDPNESSCNLKVTDSLVIVGILPRVLIIKNAHKNLQLGKDLLHLDLSP